MSYEFYSFLHIFSIIIIFMSLGGVVVYRMQGGTKADFKSRKRIGIHHGIGLIVVLISGFGMMARNGYSFSENSWLWAKVFCWFVIGGFTALAYKKKVPVGALWWILMGIAAIAVYAVVFKPF